MTGKNQEGKPGKFSPLYTGRTDGIEESMQSTRTWTIRLVNFGVLNLDGAWALLDFLFFLRKK